MRAVILFCVLEVVSAVQWRSTRIVGGSNTSVEEYPYMTNMQYGVIGLWWYQSCGGTLITTTSVLSAAHCYYGDVASSWRVILGTSTATGGGTTHSVSELIIHEDFNSARLSNDVAIVKLTTPAILSSTIALATIPDIEYALADGTIVTAIGWGTLSSGGSQPEQLQHVDINVINQQICSERYYELQKKPGYEGWPNITEGMLCLGILDVGGKDACQGDSGGPVAHNKNVIVGITSWGFGCADAHFPGVNTRVAFYADWINLNS